MTAARIVVTRRAGASVVVELESRTPVGLRPLNRGGAVARVAVLQTSGGLAAGDDVALDVCVGPGAALVLVELSATLAHPVRAAQPGIRQLVRARVGDGGRLVWLGEPLILAAGTHLARRVGIDLAGSARVLLGETVVFGRDREDAGTAHCRTRIVRDSRPLLDETLVTGDESILRSAAVAGAARVGAALTLAGVAPPLPLPAAAMALGERDTTLRVLATDAVDAAARLAAVADAWGGALADGERLLITGARAQ